MHPRPPSSYISPPRFPKTLPTRAQLPVAAEWLLSTILGFQTDRMSEDLLALAAFVIGYAMLGAVVFCVRCWILSPPRRRATAPAASNDAGTGPTMGCTALLAGRRGWKAIGR